MTDEEVDMIVEASRVFTPGAPVTSRELFAGRESQLERILQAIPSPGRHPIIFGQRGVGKTSIANIVSQLLKDALSVKVSCDGSDRFASIWNRILQNASLEFKTNALGFGREQATTAVSLSQLFGSKRPKPSEVGSFLARISQWSIFILDEFDKVTDSDTRKAFADLIKVVSDTAPHVTLVVVGVADNIGHLIGDHPSIERNLVQIEMPTMTGQEIREVVEKGFAALKITASDPILGQVPILCNGFPHYAHLIGLSCAKACARNNTHEVSQQLFDVACSFSVEDAIEKYREAYSRATYTVQTSRYPLILCGCAHAETNERGVFRATDVSDAIEAVFKKRLSIQAIVPALGEFVKRDRGAVLTPVPILKRRCYKFTDPMMVPFLKLKAAELQRTA